MAFSFSNAQKGSILVSGSVNYSNSKNSNNLNDSNSKNYAFGFSPKIGYQFADNWTVGMKSQIIMSKNDVFEESTNETSYSKSNNYYIAPFVRYTKKMSDLFSVFGDLDAGFNFGEYTYSQSNNSITSFGKQNGFEANFTPAIYLNLKNNFGLNFGIGGVSFTSITGEYNGSEFESKSNSFNLNFGQSFSVGIQKNF